MAFIASSLASSICWPPWARRGPVVAWLVGTRGQSSSRAAEFAVRYLRNLLPDLTLCDADPPASALAAVGRRLFQYGESSANSQPTADLPATSKSRSESDALAAVQRSWPIPCPPGLFLTTALTALEEVEQVAAFIKADARQARDAGLSRRLSEVAVVIPGPAYDPLIREVFPRAGLPFNLAGRALDLASSRPARLLLSALALIQGQWRADLLLDFLLQPVVRRSLAEAEQLHALFEERPRQRQRPRFHGLEPLVSAGLDLHLESPVSETRSRAAPGRRRRPSERSESRRLRAFDSARRFARAGACSRCRCRAIPDQAA